VRALKFRAERDGLLDAMSTASRAAAARPALGTGSSSIQLALHGNRLEITGSDPDLVIEVRESVAGESDGVCLVPARLVVDIIRAFESGAVSFDGNDEEVKITSGRAEFAIRVPTGAEITRLSSPSTEGITLPAEIVADGLRQVVRAALTDDTRAPQLTGVLLVATDTGLRLVATDSYRLAFRDLRGVSALEPGSDVLVPARALTELQRLIAAEADGVDGGSLLFRHSELDAIFEVGETKLTTRLLKGPFPDYERLLPPSYPNQLMTAKDDLAGALRRVRLMVRDTKDATTPVRVSFRDGGAELNVLTAESGRAVERVDGLFTGEETVVAFNPNYLLDGIDAIRSDRVVIEVIDSTKPATVRGEDESDYRYLLMPVRVS
jgi:DNA polymerase III subunit beta